MAKIHALKAFGLSENEARVYLASLELGVANVQDIAKKSGVKRTTVYTIIEGLYVRGFASKVKKGAKTFFTAENPEKLLQLSKRRYEQFKKALPELKSIYNLSPVKPKLKFYEGKEGYSAVYENILEDKPKELLVIASYKDFCRHLDPEYEKEWIKRRVKQKIKLRWLDFKTPQTRKLKAEGKKTLREMRFLPKGFPFTSTMFIYKDKVIIMSGKQKEFMAVVIENTEFYQMFKQLFRMLWERQKV